MTPDRALVEAVLAKSAGAFEHLVGVHQKLCWHIIYRMVRNPDDARDLCQETFLRVHQRLDQYRHESSLRTWIGRIAYSIAARHLERRRSPTNQTDGHEGDLLLEESIDDGFDLEAAWADQEMKRTLHAAIDELPPMQRTLLTLYHLDEVPIGEIAQITGLAIGTIKSHLFRTRARLRELLEVSVGATT